MNKFKGKRLLILSGAGPHVKIVQKAKEMGIHTIVADYLEPSKASPAKLVSDENWNISLLDIEALIKKAKESAIDGVVAAWSDIAQLPYAYLCDALNLPCYGTTEQFEIMSQKDAFKKLCTQHGVDVIPEYSIEDVHNQCIEFPVVSKPVDGRGSKGITVCNNYKELRQGIKDAEDISVSKKVIIEKYIANKNSFQVNYLFVDGEAYILRTADGYKGLVEEKLDRVALCSISPSVFTSQYMEKANQNFVEMLRAIGFKNGPVMAQGFYDNGAFRFYDPGLRFPGVDYEVLYKSLYGIDLAEIMIEYALTGKMPELELKNSNVYLDGKVACILYPTLSGGTIAEVSGMDQIENDTSVYALETRYSKGDTVEWSYTTRQRLAEIVLLADDYEDVTQKIRRIQKTITVFDVNGENMIYKPFDVDRLQKS